jgi:hypothetical protein
MVLLKVHKNENFLASILNFVSINRSNLLQFGVGGNDVPKNAPLNTNEIQMFFCGIPKARKTWKLFQC